jgi:ribosomal protein L27
MSWHVPPSVPHSNLAAALAARSTQAQAHRGNIHNNTVATQQQRAHKAKLWKEETNGTIIVSNLYDLITANHVERSGEQSGERRHEISDERSVHHPISELRPHDAHFIVLCVLVRVPWVKSGIGSQHAINDCGSVDVSGLSSHHVAQKTVGAGDKNERTVYVDMSQGDLPTDFVDRVSKCVLFMQVRYESSADDFEIADGFGQASVVVAHDGVPRFVTAKHVLKQYQDADTVKYDVSRISIGLPNNLQKRCGVDFTDENHVRDAEPLIPLRDGKTWEGIDIGWGGDFTLEALGEAKYKFFTKGKYSIEQFELPRRNGFRVMQGQKIGIAVFNKYKISTEFPLRCKD